MPMNRLVELTQLAYFEEHRQRSPRDLTSVANQLGLSLRTAGSLNRKYKGDFFTPERQVEPLRSVTTAMLNGSVTAHQINDATGLPEADVARILALLVDNGWVSQSGEEFALLGGLRSWVSEDANRRLDGLNNQMDILTSGVWASFVNGNGETARTRSWVFAARPADIEAFIDQTTKATRYAAVDMEEAALSGGSFTRYGVTIAVAPMESDDE